MYIYIYIYICIHIHRLISTSVSTHDVARGLPSPHAESSRHAGRRGLFLGRRRVPPRPSLRASHIIKAAPRVVQHSVFIDLGSRICNGRVSFVDPEFLKREYVDQFVFLLGVWAQMPRTRWKQAQNTAQIRDLGTLHLPPYTPDLSGFLVASVFRIVAATL